MEAIAMNASVAYELIPAPDWASTTTIAVPDSSIHDSRGWARAVFDIRSVPWWTKALFAAREVVAFAMRIPPGEQSMLAVREVRGGEALIDTDDRHLHFAAGVRADNDLLHVTTAVKFKGLRGRLYFVPVRFLHDQITRSMMQAAAARA
jgi:hypothetical protein